MTRSPSTSRKEGPGEEVRVAPRTTGRCQLGQADNLATCRMVAAWKGTTGRANGRGLVKLQARARL